MATNGTARSTRRGNCYVATEALYHILGGRESHWMVMRLPTRDDQHWFLKHRAWGTILDPSRLQFLQEPDYSKAKRAAFLTRRPSKRAMKLMEDLTWQRQPMTSTNIKKR